MNFDLVKMLLQGMAPAVKEKTSGWREDLSTVMDYASEKMPQQKPLLRPRDPYDLEDVYNTAKMSGMSVNDYNKILTDAEAAAFNFGPQGLMTAFHGTPHKIVGGFKKEAIGSGEGAQAFGHGFYFSDSKEIAKSYRDKLAKGAIQYNAKNFLEYTGDVRNALEVVNKYNNIDDAISFIKRKIEEATDYRNPNIIAESHWKKNLDFIEKNRSNIELRKGSLYTVDIPEPDVMLDWDKPVSQQIIAGKKPLNMMVKKNPDPIGKDDRWIIELEDGTNLDAYSTKAEAQEFIDKVPGGELYKRLFTNKGATASDYLYGMGIKGITYPAGSISGAKTTARNYVIFEPEDINIVGEELLK